MSLELWQLSGQEVNQEASFLLNELNKPPGLWSVDPQQYPMGIDCYWWIRTHHQ